MIPLNSHPHCSWIHRHSAFAFKSSPLIPIHFIKIFFFFQRVQQYLVFKSKYIISAHDCGGSFSVFSAYLFSGDTWGATRVSSLSYRPSTSTSTVMVCWSSSCILQQHQQRAQPNHTNNITKSKSFH